MDNRLQWGKTKIRGMRFLAVVKVKSKKNACRLNTRLKTKTYGTGIADKS